MSLYNAIIADLMFTLPAGQQQAMRAAIVNNDATEIGRIILATLKEAKEYDDANQ
jgi:hypothetical protein